MEQRSPEWFEARKGRITASVGGALLGFSPYRSAAVARREWVAELHGNRRDFDNADMARGRELEPIAIDMLESRFSLVLMQDAGRPFEDWLWASGDCYDDDRHGFEIKAPRKYFDPEERPDYLLQMLLQAEAYGWDTVTMVQIVDGELLCNEYFIDDLRDKFPNVIDKLQALWIDMLDSPAPPEAADAPEAFEALQEAYLTAKLALAGAQTVVDEIKGRLLEACENQPVVGSRLQVIESTRAGNVNYKALVKAHPEVDLDEYRGKPSTYLTIREVKN